MEQWKSYLRKWGQGCNVETRQEMCKPDFLSCDKKFPGILIKKLCRSNYVMHGKMKYRKIFCSKESTNEMDGERNNTTYICFNFWDVYKILRLVKIIREMCKHGF